jgi:adenylosuccinate synthase
MIKFADVIVDLQAGDTGKGKVAHSLLESETKYTHVIRYNGGGNAGHTIYHNGQKVVTHFIPCGVLYGIKSVIGLGCVVNVDKLFEEIAYLENLGFDVKNNLLIDKRVHIVTNEHIAEDGSENKIGTTKQGIGPAYRDKYFRIGTRAESIEQLKPYIFDIYDLHTSKEEYIILFEGAQGFELDIDWGDYPYVTSSHCTVGSAILNGVPPKLIRKVFGISKAYRTYVGAKNFEGDDLLFEKIRELGNEYGATTGRKRQVNWFSLDDIIKAININGVTDLVINKIDILTELNVFRIYYENDLYDFDSEDLFKYFITYNLKSLCPTIETISFSDNPYKIN